MGFIWVLSEDMAVPQAPLAQDFEARFREGLGRGVGLRLQEGGGCTCLA